MTKVALVGPGAVGKTTISLRLVTGRFQDTKMTVGLDVESWCIEDPETGQSHRVVAFDLAGQERFHFIHEKMISGSSVVLAVFDVSRMQSLFSLNDWKYVMASVPKEGRILVGNKMDLESNVTEEDVELLAGKWDIPYILVSAKSGENFEKLEEWIQGVVHNQYVEK